MNNAVVFDGDCSEDARITTRSVFKDCSADGIDEIYTSSFTLTIFDIPSGENNRFAVSYGMDKIAGELGEKGTSEVYFVNDNERLKVGVCKFDEESGVKTDIVAPVEYPSAMRKLYKDNKFKNIGLNELTKAFGRKEYFESFVNGKVII